MKASPRARGRKAKEKVVGTYLGVLVVALVVEVEEKQKAKARKDVEEATTKGSPPSKARGKDVPFIPVGFLVFEHKVFKDLGSPGIINF